MPPRKELPVSKLALVCLVFIVIREHVLQKMDAGLETAFLLCPATLFRAVILPLCFT